MPDAARLPGAEDPSEARLTTSPCNLCPRMCGARRDGGQAGACGADDRLLVARAALHFWEEPPVSGESGSGTVFFTGCPLRCVYCQNAELAEGRAGWAVSTHRLAEMCMELQRQGALNVNFVTPTHYTLDIREAVARARGLGLRLPVVWNTSGYERVHTVRELSGTVDVYLTDFKYADANLAQRYSHAADYPEVALAALEEMVKEAGEPRFDEYHGQRRMVGGVIVRHLLLPGALENSLESIELLYRRFGSSVAYSIMNQYTPVIAGRMLERFPELGTTASADDYEALLDFADSLGLADYFWQEGPAAEESFIPAWNGEGVL